MNPEEGEDNKPIQLVSNGKYSVWYLSASRYVIGYGRVIGNRLGTVHKLGIRYNYICPVPY